MGEGIKDGGRGVSVVRTVRMLFAEKIRLRYWQRGDVVVKLSQTRTCLDHMYSFSCQDAKCKGTNNSLTRAGVWLSYLLYHSHVLLTTPPCGLPFPRRRR